MKILFLTIVLFLETIIVSSQTIQLKVTDERTKVAIGNAMIHYELLKLFVSNDTNIISTDSIYKNIDTMTNETGLMEIKNGIKNTDNNFLNLVVYKMGYINEYVRIKIPKTDTSFLVKLRILPMMENFSNTIYFKKNVVTLTDEQKDKSLSGAIALFLMNPKLVIRITSIINKRKEDMNLNLSLQRILNITEYLMKRGVNGMQIEFDEMIKQKGESAIHFEISERQLK